MIMTSGQEPSVRIFRGKNVGCVEKPRRSSGHQRCAEATIIAFGMTVSKYLR